MKRIFTDYTQLELFLLGILSGTPFGIITTCTSAYLKDSGVPIQIITTFAIAKLFYSLKPLWAPFMDDFPLPVLGKMGRRKSWMVLSSLLIASVLAVISGLPGGEINYLYYCVIAIGFLSACFDISFDAYRIEKLEPEMQAIGTANAVLGYRIGMLISGAGALYGADALGWESTFLSLGIFFIIGFLFILTVKENKIILEKRIRNATSFLDRVYSFIAPFKNFFSRKYSITILASIILFRLGDAILGEVATPFYKEVGYSNSQIAVTVKGLGLAGTIIGTYLGGLLAYRLGTFKSLIIAGIANASSNLVFIWLANNPPSDTALAICVSFENLAYGASHSVFAAYLSLLCDKKYSATQYALMTSSASLVNNTLTVYSGSLVAFLGWTDFFIFTGILCFPSLIILFYLSKKFRNESLS